MAEPRSLQGPVVLATGGTGGHVFPAEALAGELEGRGVPFTLVTDSRGKQWQGAGRPGPPADPLHPFGKPHRLARPPPDGDDVAGPRPVRCLVGPGPHRPVG